MGCTKQAQIGLLALTVTLGGLALSTDALAAGGRADYDLDDNGLIEINDLEDLDAIRYEPFGTKLHGTDVGCDKEGGCRGFELTADLDFDTDQDGSVNESDEYFFGTSDGNGPGGWHPIEQLLAPFDGKGHTISNLTLIGLWETEFPPTTGSYNPPLPVDSIGAPAGLFGTVFLGSVSNLNIENARLHEAAPYGGAVVGILRPGSFIENVTVTGEGFADGNGFLGGIAGYCNQAVISESWTRVHVEGNDHVGGLIGHAVDCAIERSFSQGRVMSSRYHSFVGGLVGVLYEGSISDSYFSGDVGHSREFGGLVGTTLDQDVSRPPVIFNSFVSGHLMGTGHSRGGILGTGTATASSTFYSSDTTGVNYTNGTGATAVALADLQCPQQAGDSSCATALFAGWDTVQNSDGEPAWDFGDNQQVPALRINGVVMRDSDGDGVFDSEDDFPLDWEASRDSDGDGRIDRWREGCDESCRRNSWLVLDQFPDDPEVSLDLDLDGLPEEWNANCGTACQATSGFTLDSFPRDFDNDGVVDALDTADSDPSTAIGNDIDQDSDGLIDIDSLQDLDLARWDPTGASLLTTEIQSPIPNQLLRSMTPHLLGEVSGCPPRIVRGTLQRQCDGYELLQDLDFDENGDNVIDESDSFWANGAGWVGLGRLGDIWYAAFQTNFEGNGHTISNLYSDREGWSVGLFGGTRGANIRNVHLTGELMFVRAGSDPAGGLIGDSEMTTVTHCSSTGLVESSFGQSVGGLIGRAWGGLVQGAFATGDVSSATSFNARVGGLIGLTDHRTTVRASFASGLVFGGTSAQSYAGGLIGSTAEHDLIEASYSIGHVSGAGAEVQLGGLVATAVESTESSHWAVDSSGQLVSAGGAVGAALAQLECPTAPNDTSCFSGQTLYQDWDEHLGRTGVQLWDFGGASELPGLCLGGTLYRVDPADGVLAPPEECDAFANGQLTVNLVGSGLCRNVHITNNSPNAIDPWTIHFEAIGGTIRDFWGGSYQQVNDVVTVTPVNYNRSVQPGETIQDVGFCVEPGPSGDPGGGGGELSVAVSNVQDHGYTFCAQYAVTNTTSTSLNPWQATFNFDGNLFDLWGAAYTQTGDEVTISGVSWDPTIDAGETISGGFCGAW